MKTILAIAAIAALGPAGASADALGVGVSGGSGGSIAAGAADGGSLSGGAFAHLGFAATSVQSNVGAQNTTSADNLGGTSLSVVENTGTSTSTDATLGLGLSGADSNFASGGLAGGQFGFLSLNFASDITP